MSTLANRMSYSPGWEPGNHPAVGNMNFTPFSTCEVATRTDFSFIRYSQCWEDADVLLAAMDLRPGDHCLSIASGGENTLSLLVTDPARVVAIDLNFAQLACLELKMAAFQSLQHAELLELVGSWPSNRRRRLYVQCRGCLPKQYREFWDLRLPDIDRGIGGLGKFERYLGIFRDLVIPLAIDRRAVNHLLRGGACEQVKHLYDEEWDNWRWRILFDILCSRPFLSWWGRDWGFLDHAEGRIASRLRDRVRSGIARADPARNPYLQWILQGVHRDIVPHVYRAENFERIRSRIHRVETQQVSLEELLEKEPEGGIAGFNLSDVFEYMSESAYHRCLEGIRRIAKDGARLVYWNMLVPRHAPREFHAWLRPQIKLARELFSRNKAFFYETLVIEEVRK